MPKLKFSASATGESATKTVVKTDSFRIIIDEPPSLGGTNEGPNPVQYLLAALAGCLNVLCHMVAGEMSFTLKGLTIELEGDLDPARLYGKSMESRAGYSEVRVTIKPEADADTNTLDRWLKTVESRCPVSDNIANATPVKIQLG